MPLYRQEQSRLNSTYSSELCNNKPNRVAVNFHARFRARMKRTRHIYFELKLDVTVRREYDLCMFGKRSIPSAGVVVCIAQKDSKLTRYDPTHCKTVFQVACSTLLQLRPAETVQGNARRMRACGRSEVAINKRTK